MLITFNKICLVLTYNAESPTARRREPRRAGTPK